jgi:hypothetical protein
VVDIDSFFQDFLTAEGNFLAVEARFGKPYAVQGSYLCLSYVNSNTYQ